jgi:hypothetical protein
VLPALVLFEDALSFSGVNEANRLLVRLDENEGLPPELRGHAPRLNLNITDVIRLLSSNYPGRELRHPLFSWQIMSDVHTSVRGASHWLQLLISVFFGVALFSVINITFLDRRQEMSSLKVIGISYRQVVRLISSEYSISFTGGIVLGTLSLIVLTWMRPLWLQYVSFEEFIAMIAVSIGLCIVMYLLAMAFPVITIAVATVSDLMLSRVIPIRRVITRAAPTGDFLAGMLLHEYGMTTLKLPYDDGHIHCSVLCNEGDQVKEGQALAILEAAGGLYRRVWLAPHDGTVSLLESGRYLGISQVGFNSYS